MSELTLALSALTGGAAGSLDSIDGDDLADGHAAVVVLSDAVYHYHLNATSGATENSPYVIAPDTNAGTKRWILVTPIAPLTHVSATSDDGQTIANNIVTTVVFENEVIDSLDEYNPSTGIFTPKNNGYYLINSVISFVSAAWTSGSKAMTKIFIDDTTYVSGPKIRTPTATGSLGPGVSSVVYLTVGQYIEIIALHSQGSSLALSDKTSENWLTINRLL